jgi:asparagine synthase (glutamine-hydrolysing)
MDSSSVLAIATEIQSRRGGEPPESFSSRSSVPAGDEYEHAAALVRMTRSRNTQLLPSDECLVGEVDSLLWQMDEPVHGLAVYAHRKLLEVARSHGIVVLLDGSGGDEALSGYHHFHYPAMLLSLLRSGRLTQFAHEAHARHTVAGVPLARTLKDLLKLVVPYALRPPARPTWIVEPENLQSRLRPQPGLLEHQLFALERMPLPLYNRINDRNSMTLSMEARNPFLDYRLVEVGLALDVSDLLNSGVTKWVLRQAMRNMLPSEIVDRTAKQGFTCDENLWMQGTLGEAMEDVFLSDSFAARGYFRQDAVLVLLQEHRIGIDHSAELWRAYSLERWLRLFHDPGTLVAPPRAEGAPVPVPLDPKKVLQLEPLAGAAVA